MTWVPLIVFAVVGLLSAIAQDRYFRAIAARDGSVSTDQDYADAVHRDPSGLISITAKETSRRLRSLIHRQADRDVERQRIVALTAIATALLVFVWVVANPTLGR